MTGFRIWAMIYDASLILSFLHWFSFRVEAPDEDHPNRERLARSRQSASRGLDGQIECVQLTQFLLGQVVRDIDSRTAMTTLSRIGRGFAPHFRACDQQHRVTQAGREFHGSIVAETVYGHHLPRAGYPNHSARDCRHQDLPRLWLRPEAS
jgi:hypothetical protein